MFISTRNDSFSNPQFCSLNSLSSSQFLRGTNPSVIRFFWKGNTERNENVALFFSSVWIETCFPSHNFFSFKTFFLKCSSFRMIQDSFEKFIPIFVSFPSFFSSFIFSLIFFPSSHLFDSIPSSLPFSFDPFSVCNLYVTITLKWTFIK